VSSVGALVLAGLIGLLVLLSVVALAVAGYVLSRFPPTADGRAAASRPPTESWIGPEQLPPLCFDDEGTLIEDGYLVEERIE